MLVIDQTAFQAIRPELLDGESVLWASQPDKSVVFHQEDAMLIPFSLLWGGFAIFWEGGVLGLFGFEHGKQSPGLFVLWGIPFVFLVTAWKKSRTYYAVTDRRALVVQRGWKYRTASCYLNASESLTMEAGRGPSGTLRFGARPDIFSRNRGWGAWDVMNVESTPVFLDIQEIREVHRLVADLRDRARKTASS
jgi:hypothetical protein